MANYQTTPYPLAMVICDAVYQDQATGKFFLLGLFSTIGATEFPCTHPTMVVFVSLTDGLGDVSLRLELVHVKDEDKPVCQFDQAVTTDDPRTVIECIFRIDGVVIPEAGEYRLKLFANDEFLIERRIIVHSAKKGGGLDE